MSSSTKRHRKKDKLSPLPATSTSSSKVPEPNSNIRAPMSLKPSSSRPGSAIQRQALSPVPPPPPPARSNVPPPARRILDTMPTTTLIRPRTVNTNISKSVAAATNAPALPNRRLGPTVAPTPPPIAPPPPVVAKPPVATKVRGMKKPAQQVLNPPLTSTMENKTLNTMDSKSVSGQNSSSDNDTEEEGETDLPSHIGGNTDVGIVNNTDLNTSAHQELQEVPKLDVAPKVEKSAAAAEHSSDNSADKKDIDDTKSKMIIPLKKKNRCDLALMILHQSTASKDYRWTLNRLCQEELGWSKESQLPWKASETEGGELVTDWAAWVRPVLSLLYSDSS